MKAILSAILVFSLLMSACGSRGRYATVVPSPPQKAAPPEAHEVDVSQSYVVNGIRYYPLPDSVGYDEIGKASWYGEKFHGRPTSSGEIYDMYQKSAAHKTLPLGTIVRVENLRNNQYTVLRVNDRGPFVEGRIIDLSYAAAKEVGLIGPGVEAVRVTALGREVRAAESSSGLKALVEAADFKSGVFSVQIGAFQDEKNARHLADRLKVIFEYVDVFRYADENNQVFFRVRVSMKGSLEEAGEIKERLRDMGFVDAFVVRL